MPALRPHTILLSLALSAILIAASIVTTVHTSRAVATGGNTCLSSASGAWSDPASWYLCGGGTPGATDTAYIQSGHLITLTQDEAVNDLHISTGQASATSGNEGTVNLGQYALNLYGKLRNYYAPVGNAPGTSSTIVGYAPLMMTAGGTGRLRVVGNSRNLTNAEEWSANNTGTATTFAIEIALSANQTVTLQTNIKASNWLITSGALDAGVNRIVVDSGVTGVGDVTVADGATLISSASSLNAPVLARTLATRAGALTVQGTLVLKGIAPFLAMNSIHLTGAVEYSAAGLQGLAAATSSGAPIDSYTHLILANSGAKTLVSNVTVNGLLTRSGAATLATGAYAFSYGAAAGIRYAGSASQTTGAELTGTVDQLVVANPAGVILAGDRTVATQLTLETGNLYTQGYVLTLGSAATCSGTGDVVGTVSRPHPTAGTTYCFGHPDVQATIETGSTPPTALAINLVDGAAPFTGAINRLYTISAPGFAGRAALRLHYRAADLNGNTTANLQLWRQTGSQWMLEPRTGSGDGYVEKNNITAFSQWTLAGSGTPTAVTLAAFGVQSDQGQARVTWTTGSELDNAGFYLWRNPVGGPRVRITPVLIPAHNPGSATGSTYTYTDDSVPPAQACDYWLEAVDLAGNSSLFGPARLPPPPIYLPWIAAF